MYSTRATPVGKSRLQDVRFPELEARLSIGTDKGGAGLDVDQRPVDGALRQIIGFQAVGIGGAPLYFATDRVGQGECNRR